MRNFKKFLALVLAMMMVVGGMVTVSAAEEAATYDYTPAAEALADLGIVKGTSDDVIDFALEDKVVRYQMALLVARIMTGEVDDTYWNQVVENTTPFDDVTKYYGAIAYVADNEIVEGKGWIAGVGDNCFDPEGPITYEQALTMAVRALGYKQLVYPTGFVNTAKALGLTDGLEELAGDTQLTRGQMFQIIYNLFFTAGKDGKDFAAKAFGLETKSYVVVATENQALAGANRVYRVDYEGKGSKWSKYVALAPINADGSYNFDAIIHLTEGELGMEFKESEYRIGYSYTVQSFDGFKTAYKATANDTKTLQNYGDLKAEIAAGSKYHGQADQLIKLDGTTYKLVEAYTDLNNKDSYANRQPELIVHSMFEGDAVVESTSLYYDMLGNVVDPATGNILITYNSANGVYYVQDANGYFRIATDADFAAAAAKISNATAQYGVVTSVDALLTDVDFCEITLFDDDNNGVWDRALYIPYSIGKYTTATATAFNVTTSANAAKQTVGQINGVTLGATVEKADKTWGTVTAVRQDDIDFIGEGRPSNGQYVVYYYNSEGRVFNTLEKASVKYGKVTAVNQGTYSYDSLLPGYFWKNATVTVEGEEAPIVMGYRPYQTYSQIVAAGKTDLTTIHAEIATYGYDKTVYNCLLNNSFMQLGYVELADRIVYVTSKDTRKVAGEWLAFDYGTEKINTASGVNGYTTYGYEGDIIGVDEDGNILVNAYVQGKADQVVVAIGSINGFDTFGELVADYAALNFNFSGIGILGNDQYETMQKIVIRRFFDTLSKDLGVDENGEEIRQMMYTVTDVEDGVYSIYTDINVYWGNDGNPYRQPTALWACGKLTSVVTINNGVADASFGGSYGYLKFNENSKFIVIGKDGIRTATGIPEDGTQFNFKDTGAGVYDLGTDLTVFVAPNALCEEVYTGLFDDQASAGGYTYYLVVGDITSGKFQNNTTATVVWDANGVGTYTYTNMFNMSTGTTAPAFTVVNGLPGYTTETRFDLNAVKPLGAIYAEKNGKWTLVNTIVEGAVPEGNVITKVKYAPEARQDIIDLMYTGKDGFAPIYANRGISQGGVGSGYNWNYKNDAGEIVKIYEYAIKIANPHQYMVNYNADGLTTNVGAATNAGIVNKAFVNKTQPNGDPCYMYFNYVPGVSFDAAYVYGSGKSAADLAVDAEAKAEADAAALAAAKAEAPATIDAYAAENAAYATEKMVADAKAAAAAATDVAGVEKAIADFKAAVDAAKKAEEDAAALVGTVTVDGATATMNGAADQLADAFGASVTKMFKGEIFEKVDGKYVTLAAANGGNAFGGQEGTIDLTNNYKITVKLADGNVSVTPFSVDDADYTYNLFDEAGEYLVRITVSDFSGKNAVKLDFVVVIAE